MKRFTLPIDLGFIRVGLAAVLICFVLRFFGFPIVVSGDSMAPRCRTGQVAIASRLAYYFESPNRGDLVILRTETSGELLLKRIVGLPHEEIKMIWGGVYINGTKFDEPYVKTDGGWTMLPVSLEDGEYWVIGDNRSESKFCKVQRSEIIGKALM